MSDDFFGKTVKKDIYLELKIYCNFDYAKINVINNGMYILNYDNKGLLKKLEEKIILKKITLDYFLVLINKTYANFFNDFIIEFFLFNKLDINLKKIFKNHQEKRQFYVYNSL